MKRLLPLLLAALACGPANPAVPTTPAGTPLPTGDASSLWSLTLGDVKSDQAWGVDTDSAGNIYLAAYMQSPGELFYDMVIYKFSSAGEELWQTRWGGDLQEKAFIVTVSEPVVYVGGLTHTAAGMEEADMALLALDMESGAVLWEFTWGQGFGYEEIDGLVVQDGFIYLSGWTTGEQTGGDIAVLKLDLDGSLIWAKTWGTAGFDTADGQMVVDDEAIFVSGRVEGANMLFGGDAALVKFSKQTGDYLEHTTWGGANFDDGLGLTGDGEFLYVVGLTLSFGDGGQIFLLKFDHDLKLLWEQVWGGPQGESARVVEADGNGNILIAGNTASHGSGKDDIVLLQYSPEGALNWFQTWGGAGQDAVQGLALDGDFAYLAGNTHSFSAGQDDALLIKADSRSGQFPAAGGE